MSHNVICVDVGGTNIRVARATNLQKAEFSEVMRTAVTHNYRTDLEWVINAAHRLAQGKPIEALGIGVPGRVNDGKTLMNGSNNLPEWRDQEFVKQLIAALECPVYMDNDGIAAGFGEAYFGSQPATFDFLIWATGISAVRIQQTDGRVQGDYYLRRQFHNLFENWELYCGGKSILQTTGVSPDKLSPTQLEEVLAKFTGHFKAYIDATHPASIVVGGGLALAHADYLQELAKSSPVPLVVTQFGEQFGLVGALGLIRRVIKPN